MARPYAQAKGGFYAAPPQAIAKFLERIHRDSSKPCHVLDPCAGCGDALLQITNTLDAIPWAIELDEARSEKITARLPSNHYLAPCDFAYSHISPSSMSLIWCNPPFDYHSGDEGRVEWAFIERALPSLVVGGVMALVCPENIGMDWRTRRWFRAHFSDRMVMEFPESCRKYKEIIFLGTRRKQPTDNWGGDSWDDLLNADQDYWLPRADGPRVFSKTEPTDGELAVLLKQSPLRNITKKNDCGLNVRPPLPPSKGHLALLLASGHLNGVIRPNGEPAHVLRGTAYKEDYLASINTNDEPGGGSTTQTIYSQRIKLLLRVVTREGKLIDLL